MALIKCPECGKEISDKAISCPNCGMPFPAKKYCKYCGGQIDENCVICPNCGKQVECLVSSSAVISTEHESKTIPVICGTFGIVFPLVFGWTLFETSPLTAIPSICLLIVGILCLCGIGKRNISKAASIVCAIGIALGLLTGLGFIAIFFVLGFLEVIYYSKL